MIIGDRRIPDSLLGRAVPPMEEGLIARIVLSIYFKVRSFIGLALDTPPPYSSISPPLRGVINLGMRGVAIPPL